LPFWIAPPDYLPYDTLLLQLVEAGAFQDGNETIDLSDGITSA